MKRRSLGRNGRGRLIMALMTVAFALGCGRPASSPVRRAVTLVAPMTAWSWPMYIAEQSGYYDQYGLDVRLKFANHPAGIATLLSGEADANLLPLERAMEVIAKDDSFVAVGSPLGKWLFALVARGEISSVGDLKGGSLGVAQIGDATYRYARLLLAKWGLDMRDVHPVLVGAEGRIPALVSGRIDATMLSAPAYFALVGSGYRILANIMDHADIHTPNVLLFKKRTIQRWPELPELLVEAHSQAVLRFYNDREFALNAHLAYDRQDRADLGRVYDVYTTESVLDRVPYILADAVRFVRDATEDPVLAEAMRNADYGAALDNRTIDRLAGRGFFRDLFGSEGVAEQELKAPRAFR